MVAPVISLGGDELLELADAAVVTGLNPATLYHRGLRGELELVRLANGRWAARRWQIEALAAQLNPKASPTS
ncbi:MAG: hypothetical protein SFU57_00225 [Gemmatimonadales bacterium]|nr:hypothetical protein [Gemmatimonadales bacterium]